MQDQTTLPESLLTSGRVRLLLRWLLVVATGALALFAGARAPSPFLSGLLLAFILSNVLLMLLPRAVIARRPVEFALFVGDVAVVSLAIYLADLAAADFFLIYFLLILASTLGKSLPAIMGMAIGVCAVYAALTAMQGLEADGRALASYLRVAFLFAMAVFYGGLADLALREQRRRREYQELSRMDPLTGLPNRRAFDEQFARELTRACRFGRPLSCIVIDLDRFKTVNDQHGHMAGDDLLREMARVLAEGTRRYDFLARWGGDEFAMVLPETDPATAEQTAERLRARVAGHRFGAGGQTVNVTLSLGGATWTPEAGRHVGEAVLIGRADEALLHAKRDGGNRGVFLPLKGSEGSDPDGVAPVTPADAGTAPPAAG
ncbi:MAG: GGDEF domain-containing protein [Deltaproteobacteria bacterium]|nr:GGDEF domain-containing protein [Deltaproteobacteria bacterium]